MTEQTWHDLVSRLSAGVGRPVRDSIERALNKLLQERPEQLRDLCDALADNAGLVENADGGLVVVRAIQMARDGDPEAAGRGLRVLAQHLEGDVRQSALGALPSVPENEESLAILLERSSDSVDEVRRMAAAGLAGYLGDEQALEALERLQDDRIPGVQAQAIDSRYSRIEVADTQEVIETDSTEGAGYRLLSQNDRKNVEPLLVGLRAKLDRLVDALDDEEQVNFIHFEILPVVDRLLEILTIGVVAERPALQPLGEEVNRGFGILKGFSGTIKLFLGSAAVAAGGATGMDMYGQVTELEPFIRAAVERASDWPLN